MLTLLLTLVLTDSGKPAPELAPPPSVGIVGWYSFEVEHQGEQHTGIVVIRPAQKGAHPIRWHTDAGVIQGIAFREDGYLWVSWRDAQSFGLCRYRVEVKDNVPQLVGDRGTTEVLTWLRDIGR